MKQFGLTHADFENEDEPLYIYSNLYHYALPERNSIGKYLCMYNSFSSILGLNDKTIHKDAYILFMLCLLHPKEFHMRLLYILSRCFAADFVNGQTKLRYQLVHVPKTRV